MSITTYLGYACLIMFGHLRDFFGKNFPCLKSRYFGGDKKPKKGYAPLLADWENLYTRRLYHRIQGAWNRPIAGPPKAGNIKVVERISRDNNCTMETTDKERDCLNLGSYNYLGFADDWNETCRKSVLATLEKFPVSVCTSAAEGGYTSLHRKLEVDVAKFVGKEAALVFNMGYGTNFLGIPAIAGKGCLIISDSLNHTSIVNGSRTSGATIRVFKHNDMDNLESMLRQAIVDGQEKTHRPWRKIIVMVEGIYSMEGEICDLPSIVRIAKRYKAFVYLDEAHSIGATGPTGRGVCEHTGVNPADVDILMGTFTKSFGAMGGYIAGSQEFIDYVRANSAGFLTDNTMSPVVCQQILSAFSVIKGEDGTTIGREKLRRLKENSNYFREKLEAMGVEVFGSRDSPVIPMMLYNPTKISAFSRECLARGLAVVVVGFPATPLLLSRTRFCVSAGHTRADLDKALKVIKEVVDLLQLRYRTHFFG